MESTRTLAALAYHERIVDYLRKHEPEVWKWTNERTTREEQLEALRALLLRDTYRIEASSHPEVHTALAAAMQRLGISAPATLYQSSDREMNAALVFVPGEIHIVLHGPVLERLAPEELLALLGHELSHYLLWSQDGGQYLVADRILDESLMRPGAAASHAETRRLYALTTELFADRGGALAAGHSAAAVAALVKIQTGMATVDPAAYLRQVVEIEARETAASKMESHPETFLRARAVGLWWDGAPELEAWTARHLFGPVKLDQLDMLGQSRMQDLTRGFIAYFLDGGRLASEPVSNWARQMFQDWQDGQDPIGPEAFGAADCDDSVRNYLIALMVDVAMADPDQQDVALLRAGRVAQALDCQEVLLASLQRDCNFGKRELDRYKRQLAKEAKA